MPKRLNNSYFFVLSTEFPQHFPLSDNYPKGQCGYDLNKSMDKLLDMSASTLRKSDDIINIGVKKVSFLVCHLVLLMLLTRMDED
ncbi:hypothetical protein KY285_018675 [Solanum tuberosum]|nr:hypothetical protein KY285_018675 [Solanum tuberosum]